MLQRKKGTSWAMTRFSSQRSPLFIAELKRDAINLHTTSTIVRERQRLSAIVHAALLFLLSVLDSSFVFRIQESRSTSDFERLLFRV